MVLGIIIAFSVFKISSVNAVALGVVVGYLFGNLLYNLFVKVITVNPLIVYWIIVSSCIVIVMLAGGFMKNYMVCLATSLVGGYAIVRGISVFAKGYPDETYVMMLINKGEFAQFGRVFGPKIYLYIGLIFLFTAIGFWIQTYMIPPAAVEEDKEGDKGEPKEKQDHEHKDENKPEGEKKDTAADKEATTTATKI